jgi:aspartate carbamoyltransferase catalytic subunit
MTKLTAIFGNLGNAPKKRETVYLLMSKIQKMRPKWTAYTQNTFDLRARTTSELFLERKYRTNSAFTRAWERLM